MSIIKKFLFNIVVLTSAIAGELDDNAYRQCYVAGRRSIDDRISDIYQWMITTKNLRSNDWFLSGFSTINYSQKERTDEIDIEGLTILLTRMCGTVLAAATAAGIPVIINEVIQGAVSFFDDIQKGNIVLTKTGRKEIAKQFHIFKSPNYRYVAAYFLSFNSIAETSIIPFYTSKTKQVILKGEVDFFELFPRQLFPLPPLAEQGSTEDSREREHLIISLERSRNDISVEHEEIYRQFLCGKLVYRPNPDSDDGKVEMLIADLVNPLEGDFNLARCEKYPDMDRILMISTGYRKAKEFSDANRTHVRIVPKFVIERDLRDPRTAATVFPYKDIMKNWSEECPFGIFVTWGNWDEMIWYDYLTTSTSEELSNNKSLYDNWKDSRYHGFMERAYSVLSRGRTRESDGTWAERAKLFTIEF